MTGDPSSATLDERVAGRTVLHVTTTDISLELLLGPHLSALKDAGMRVVTASAPGPHVAPLLERGVEHIPLNSSTRSMSLASDARAIRELASVIRSVRPDIIHLHNPKPGVYGRILGRILGVPVVVNTVHGLYAQPSDRLAKRAVVYSLERIAAAFSHAELIQNPEDIVTLRSLRVPDRKLNLLGNGIDLDRFRPAAGEDDGDRSTLRAELGISSDAVVVLAVGRMVAEKGYPELFEAFESIVDAGAELVVVGPAEPDKSDGMTNADLERAATSGVHFTGFRDDVHRWYRAADIYVLASHREGFPRSAMEAAASGLPVIATDIRGCRQVVEHDRTGKLVAVRSPQDLAVAMAQLIGDATARREMGAAGVAKAAAEFDQRTQIAITKRVYAQYLPPR